VKSLGRRCLLGMARKFGDKGHSYRILRLSNPGALAA
jgi:hypothetical protein